MTETTQELLARLAGFTPGPWGAALEKGCHGIVASFLGEEFNMVALIGNDTDTPDREPMRFANAALIAAAPDLHRIATDQAAEIARLRGALQLGVKLVEQDDLENAAGWDCFYSFAYAALQVQP